MNLISFGADLRFDKNRSIMFVEAIGVYTGYMAKTVEVTFGTLDIPDTFEALYCLN